MSADTPNCSKSMLLGILLAVFTVFLRVLRIWTLTKHNLKKEKFFWQLWYRKPAAFLPVFHGICVGIPPRMVIKFVGLTSITSKSIPLHK